MSAALHWAALGCTSLLRERLGLALGSGKYNHVACPTGLDFIKSSCTRVSVVER